MIVVAGESLIDFVHRPKVASQGPRGPLYEACPGGSPYNCAIALGRLGVETGFLCPLSDDSLGRLLAERLTDSDVTALQSAPVKAPTSLAVVSLSPEGSASYSFYREGTADRQLDPERLAAALPEQVTAFQIGSLALIEKADGPAWSAALEAAAARGALISLDPNVRMRLIEDYDDYRVRLMSMLAKADMIKASDEDLDYLYPGLSPEDAIRRVMDEQHITLTVLTRGAEGATAYTKSGLSAAMPAKTFVAESGASGDTIGAGDSFQAGLLAWLSRNDRLSKSGLKELDKAGLEAMLKFASTVAGLNCAETGCNPPRLAHVEAALA